MSSSKRKKHQVKNKKKLFPLHSKLMLSLITTMLVSLCLVGGTMAWFTSVDSATNEFEGTHLLAEIDETFSPKANWKPGEKETKEIRVKNTGQVPAFVRLSLYEFLVNFDIDIRDQIGNGNIKDTDQIVQPVLDETDTDTWESVAQNHGTFSVNSTHYIVKQAWVSAPASRTGMVEYGNDKRQEVPFKYLALNYNNNVKTEVDEIATEDYWLYDNGYFYYSKPLKPGEMTGNLLNSITLSGKIPNQFKGSLYKMKVYMDAHDETQTIFGSWGLSKDDPAYILINSQLN